MAPKRKSSAPRRANEGKRQAMTWNMFDGQTADTSIDVDVIIDDTSPTTEEQPRPVKDSVDPQSTSTKRKWVSPRLAEVEYISGLVDKCCFWKPILKKMPLKPGQWQCKLGEFKLHISGVQPDVIERILHSKHRIVLYIDTVDGDHVMHFEEGVSDKKKANTTLNVTCFTEMPSACLSLLKFYTIPLVMVGWVSDTALITLSIHMTERAVGRELKYPKQSNRTARTPFCDGVRRIMEYFYNIPYAGNGLNELHFFI